MPFFLDMFSEVTLRKLLPEVAASAGSTTLWLITDFTDQGKWWQKILLSLMYLFFRRVCNIEAGKLPNWSMVFDELNFKEIESKSFYGGFIESHCYHRIVK